MHCIQKYSSQLSNKYPLATEFLLQISFGVKKNENDVKLRKKKQLRVPEQIKIDIVNVHYTGLKKFNVADPDIV